MPYWFKGMGEVQGRGELREAGEVMRTCVRHPKICRKKKMEKT